MTSPILERDWRYLCSIKNRMLDELCSRILAKAVKVAGEENYGPHKRYQALYRHMMKADGIVSDCFDDWRRSTITNKIVNLRHYGLLRDENVKYLSENAQDWLQMVEKMLKSED